MVPKFQDSVLPVFLNKKGFSTTLLESSAALGGKAASIISQNEHIYELGGRNISVNNTAIAEILDHFPPNLLEDQHSKYHYVLNKNIYAQDGKISFKSISDMLKGMGIIGFIQFVFFYFKVRQNKKALKFGTAFMKAIEKRYDDKTIVNLFTKRLSHGVLRILANVTAGLSVSEMYYSNLLMAFNKSGRTITFKKGIHQLHHHLAKNTTVKYQSKVKRIEIVNDKVEGLTVEENGELKKITCENVVLAVPAHVIPDILKLPHQLIDKLQKVRYLAITLVQAVYNKDVFPENITSLCMEESGILGHCSANRVYQKNHVRYTLSGPKAREVINLSDSELLEIAEKELKSVLPFQAECLDFHVYRYPRGVCAYAPNYSDIFLDFKAYVSKIKGLEIAGDYISTAKIEDCIQTGFEASEKIVSNFESVA